MLKHVEASLDSAAEALSRLRGNRPALEAIVAAGELMARALKDGGRIYSCGNGGSMCDAMHFAEELSGKFREERPPLPAMAISDPAHLSCTANDFGYDAVFSRFVEAHVREGDVLLAISTSGTSTNVLKAAQAAVECKANVVALTGREGCALGKIAHIHICTPGGTPHSDRIQELHIKVIHTLIELCEREVFPVSYR